MIGNGKKHSADPFLTSDGLFGEMEAADDSSQSGDESPITSTTRRSKMGWDPSQPGDNLSDRRARSGG